MRTFAAQLVGLCVLASVAWGCREPGPRVPGARVDVRCPMSGRVCAAVPGAAVTCEGERCIARSASSGERTADCADRGVYAEDLERDASNCGACGHACSSAMRCVRGVCVAGCPTDTVFCANACRDLSQDPANCGACGRVCPWTSTTFSTCIRGECVRMCVNGCADCDGAPENGCEVSTVGDARNCGACGHACSSGEVCLSGRCGACDAPFVACMGTCIDVGGNPAHCGACDHACDVGALCLAGRCVVCPEGYLRCDDAASTCGVNPLESREHCGGCSTRCNAGPGFDVACVAGRCVVTCAAGRAVCGGDAASCGRGAGSDDAHCGPCDDACAAGSICVGGRCTHAPIRPRAPISARFVTSARPWFRWDLPSGVEGARVEVCATPSCDRVEVRVDVEGDRWRPPEALTPGVHFWRLFARTGGTVDATPGPAWELVVPAPDSARSPWRRERALFDVNLDGVTDRILWRLEPTTGGRTRWMLDVYLGGSASTAPDQVVPGYESAVEVSSPDLVSWSNGAVSGVIPLGDVNGDGYGDVLVRESVARYLRDGLHSRMATFETQEVFVGGSRGLAFVPAFSFEFGSIRNWYTPPPTVMSERPLGDLDGDGFGDWFSLASIAPSDLQNQVFFGGRPRFDEGSILGDRRQTPLDVGDFDADGDSEVIFTYGYNDTSARTDGFTVVSGVLRGVRPDARTTTIVRLCGGITELDEVSGINLEVLDSDDDGYDDVIFGGSVEGRTRVFLYRGGADGLSSARCELLP